MRVGVITFHFVHNQGAVLQCWASQTVLEKLGHEVCIIDYRPEYHTVRYAPFKNPFAYARWYWRRFQNRRTAKRIVLTMRSFVRCLTMNVKGADRRKEELFASFRQKNLKLSRPYKSLHALQKNPPALDACMSGSDQLWNPNLLDHEYDPAYFLDFGETEMCRFTYAVSAGKVPTDAEAQQVRSLCERMDAVSLREYDADMIRAINRSVDICIDPTLLLDEHEYAAIEAEPIEKEPYIFVYGFENTYGLHLALETAQKRYGCRVVNGSPERIHFGKSAKAANAYAPDVFLSYIRNACCVVTNSFHGTALSIVYKKKFITVSHSTRGSRMTQLLDRLGLTYCLWGSDDFDFEREIDYADAYERMEKLRAHALNYIKDALNRKADDRFADDRESYIPREIRLRPSQSSVRYVHKGADNSKPLPRLYEDRENCCGCSACFAVCPVQAIVMQPDREGFLYPTVDAQKCVRCYRCIAVCAFKEDQRMRGYMKGADEACP